MRKVEGVSSGKTGFPLKDISIRGSPGKFGGTLNSLQTASMILPNRVECLTVRVMRRPPLSSAAMIRTMAEGAALGKAEMLLCTIATDAGQLAEAIDAVLPVAGAVIVDPDPSADGSWASNRETEECNNGVADGKGEAKGKVEVIDDDEATGEGLGASNVDPDPSANGSWASNRDADELDKGTDSAVDADGADELVNAT